jgi:hypothetical protein
MIAALNDVAHKSPSIKENAAARNYSGSTPVIINEPARFIVTAYLSFFVHYNSKAKFCKRFDIC